MTDAIRLSKRLAEQLGCSRREAELYIEGGWVSVDGQVIEVPWFKVGQQRIELLPGATAIEVPPVTLLLHKPASQAPAAEPSAIQAQLAQAAHWSGDDARLAPRARHFAQQAELLPLEAGIGGLAVFSQQREVIRRLNDARNPLEQEYTVEVTGEAEPGGMELLAKGIGHRGKVLPRAKASWQNETHLRIVLKAPQAGDLRQLCEAIGLRMLSVKRIRIGRLSMARLPLGEWRFLGEHERF